MAKQGGLGDNLYVDGVDISGDIGGLNRIGGGTSPLMVTGINKSAPERIGGLMSGGIEYQAWWNAEGAHPVLSSLPTANRILTYCRGTTLGADSACLVAKQLNFDPSRAQDGALTIAGTNESTAGVPMEWGTLLTAGIRADSAGTAGTSVDFTAASAGHGAQAYLHLFALTGTDVTVEIEGSPDEGVWSSVAAFAAATEPGVQRVITAADAVIPRYLRVSTAGTFTDAQFAVVAVVNEVEVNAR